MAVSTVKSTEITNTEASPHVQNLAGVAGGRIRIAQGTMEIAITSEDEVGDVILLARLPSSAVIISIELANDILDGVADLAYDVGIYDQDGVVVDADAYASAITQLQAAAAFASVENEARDIDNVGQPIYKDANALLTEDPGVEYDIGLTCTTPAATDAAGTLSYRIYYAID
jgi:hypothetical protein